MFSIRDLLHRSQGRPHELPATPEKADNTLFARVRPKTVLVEERYEVRQEVSRNPDTTLESGASGTIKIEVPYDGHHHVTRSSLDDVRPWLARHADLASVEGRIGHLVVRGHQDTDLEQVTGQAGRTIALPLTMPFRSAELSSDTALAADRFTFRHEIRYKLAPGRPKVVPVELKIEVTDPGTISGQQIHADGDAVLYSQQPVAFQRYLEVSIEVKVYIAGRKGWNPPNPHVRRIRLAPPRGLSLALSAAEVTDADKPDEGRLVHQDAAGTGLEWFDIPTILYAVPKEDSPRVYHTPRMRVQIQQPGELFSARRLVVHAEVETDGVLLSGSDVRLFDACGHKVRGPRNPLTVRSLVSAEATVVLDDAFARRTFEPQQTFHFDEVIPDGVRVEDIKLALRDLQFVVKPMDIPETKVGKTQTLIAFLNATRGDPDDVTQLWLLVWGRQQRTERRSERPGGRRFTSKLDTGDLILVVFGSVPRDSRQLVHDVNALQVGLRDQFRRVQAQR